MERRSKTEARQRISNIADFEIKNSESEESSSEQSSSEEYQSGKEFDSSSTSGSENGFADNMAEVKVTDFLRNIKEFSGELKDTKT